MLPDSSKLNYVNQIRYVKAFNKLYFNPFYNYKCLTIYMAIQQLHYNYITSN